MYKKRKGRQGLALLLALGLTAFQLPVPASAASGITPPEEKAAEQTQQLEDKSGGFIFQWNSELPKAETAFKAGDGEIIWTPILTEDKVTSGKLLLKNISIDNPSGMGIWMCVPLEITLEGTNKITSSSNGIYLRDANAVVQEPMNLTIIGPGSLEIDSQGNGILIPETITLDNTQLTVSYGSAGQSAHGIYTTDFGNIIIRNNSHIKAKSCEGIANNLGAIATQNVADILISDSHVIAINDDGPAIKAFGKLHFISSDVRAIGNTSTGYISGALGVAPSSDGSPTFIIDGGTLYAENKGTDYDIQYVPSASIGKNSAVLYFNHSYNYLLPSGDSIQYKNCQYDESTDIITSVGDGSIFGHVNWNDNVRFSAGTQLTVGYWGNYSLTIPEGASAEIPAGSNLNNSMNTSTGTTGTIINNGTLNLPQGSALYNYFYPAMQIGSTVINNGQINVASGAVFQNQNNLQNNGTINTEGTFLTVLITGYNSTISDTGTINGFINEMHDTKYVNVAYGNTVLKTGQMLKLGADPNNSGNRTRSLRIPEESSLTIEQGAVVDAKTYVTADDLSQYLDLNAPLIVNGLLLLPENIPETSQSELLDKIEGSGSVRIGDTDHYIVTADLNTDASDSVQKQLVAGGETATLPENPAWEGYRFDGWYTTSEDGSSTKFNPDTPITAGLTVTAKWTGLNEWTTELTMESWTYGDTPKAPSATPKFGEDAVSYTYSDSADGIYTETLPENAGTWYIKASVDATDDYTGLISVPVAFTIAPKAYAENGDITISEINSAADAENITVTWNSHTLAEGKDYEKSTNRTGDYVNITITFKGNYSGKAVRTYKDHLHSFSDKWTSDDINHWHQCACGDKIDIQEHSFVWETTIEPSEFVPGEEQGTCSVCSYVIKRTISALGHSYGTDWKFNDSQHWHECSCGDKTDLAAHSFEWTVIKEATETEEGAKQGTCSVCSHTVTETIPTLEHTHNYGSEWMFNETDHWHECSCGDKAEIQEHSFVWEITTEPSEFVPGEEQGTCSVCSYVIKRTLSALGHSYGTDWKFNDSQHWHECACGDKTDLAAHSFEWTVIKEATETEEGAKQGTCPVCSHTVTETIPTLEHTHNYGSEWKFDENEHWHECTCGDKTDSETHSFQEIIDLEPTAEETGLKHDECSICHYQTAAVTIPPTGIPADNAQVRVQISTGFAEIPDSLAKAGYDTEDKITSALLDVLVNNAGYTSENSVVYDVKLQISFDGGKTWEDATADNFPAEGLEVTLPYPDGTNGTEYDFTVTHMFAYDMNGYKAGDVETPDVEKTDTGICFKVMGLSPIGVAWKSVGSGEHTHQYGEPWISGDEGHWHECIICGEPSVTAVHDYQWIIDKEATGTEAGLKHEECSVCGYRGETAEIPATPEKPSETVPPVPTDAPATEPPAATDIPAATDTPPTAEPVPTDAPATTEPPATDVPVTTAPPATDVPATTEPPATDAPATTEPPATDAPATTEPPATDNPAATESPATDAPAITEPPVTDAPATTEPPATDNPAATESPATDAPATTEPPATDNPAAAEPPAADDSAEEAPTAVPEYISPMTGERHPVKLLLLTLSLIGAGLLAAGVCKHKNSDQ